MGGGDISDYVQDGLILHWDGFNIDTTNKKWIDLKNNIALGFESNAFAFPDSGYIYKSAKDNSGLWSDHFASDIDAAGIHPYANGGTIEAVVEIIDCRSSAEVYILNGDQSHSPGLLGLAISSGNWCDQYSLFARNISSVTGIKVVSSCRDNAMENGVPLTYVKRDYFGSGTGTAVGYRSGRSVGAIMKVYSIRMYDHALSPAEMLSNQKVDNKRFYLGLSL